jgi:hypothetical protein
MRVLYYYGTVSGGGCERRMGDLCRWFLDNGDEAWIVGSKANDMGYAMLHGQCGVPPSRTIWMHDEVPGGSIEEFIMAMAQELKADIIDHQWWGMGIPTSWEGIKAVATLHGYVGLPHSPFYDGVISVEDLPLAHEAFAMAPKVRTIWNWANLERFPFREELPDDKAAFIGRAFKTINAKKVAWMKRDLTIDCFGTAPAGLGNDWPDNMRWYGYAKPEDIIYNYRVIFASAIAALEALAAGRLVIAGQTYANRAPWGHLVRPCHLEDMSRDQFASKGHPRHHDAKEPSAEEVLREFEEAMAGDHLEMRRENRAYIEEHHSKDGQCQRVRDFYEEVLAG